VRDELKLADFMKNTIVSWNNIINKYDILRSLTVPLFTIIDYFFKQELTMYTLINMSWR